MVAFVGKDFLNMKPPRGYVAGVGRGAVGFSTQRPPTSLKPSLNKNQQPRDLSPAIDQRDRFADAEEEEAEDIYAMIDQKRQRKRKQRVVQDGSQAEQDGINAQKNNPKPENDDLRAANISMDEWLHLPDASDSTRRNKRLRQEHKQSMRFYTASDKLAMTQEDVKLAELERQKRMLQERIKNQPNVDIAYLQLADVEYDLSGVEASKKIVQQGIARNSRSEALWLKLLDLHNRINEGIPFLSAEILQLAKRACEKVPESEKLWLRRVELTPTKVEKLLLVHEALMKCMKSAELWKLAASLEDADELKKRVLDTALQLGVQLEEPSNGDSTKIPEPNQHSNSSRSEPQSVQEDANDSAPKVKEDKFEDTSEDDISSKPLIQQRAILSRKTRESPHRADLWIRRITLEINDHKPFKHIITEALQHNPQDGDLWALELKHTESRLIKSRIAEAVKASKGSMKVLKFGADYFRSIGNAALAEKWEARIK